MSDIITRKNKKGKEIKYEKADSEKLNEFLNAGYGIEINLAEVQERFEEGVSLRLATPVNNRATVNKKRDDESR